MTDRVRWVGVLGLLTLLFTAPYLGLPVHLQSLLYVLFFWVTLATSWNMLSGYSGYFSFGHGAFFGVGMYGMATLATKLEWPLWASSGRKTIRARSAASSWNDRSRTFRLRRSTARSGCARRSRARS